ncbi:hypothetical protein CYMTET_17843, partial [Cymbomonas tetramitiformis]
MADNNEGFDTSAAYLRPPESETQSAKLSSFFENQDSAVFDPKDLIVGTSSLLASLKKSIALRDLCIRISKLVLTICFYTTVMMVHLNAQDSFQTVSSVAQRVLPPLRGVEFMDWFKTMVWQVWEDPVCGDGLCVSPHEFPSFGRFGCKVDCGSETELATTMLFIE